MYGALNPTILQQKLEDKHITVDWINQYLTNGIATADARPLIINTLNKISTDILEFFTLFLLSGQYNYVKPEDWESQSQNFKVFLENKSIDFEVLISIHGDLAYEAQDYFLTNVVKPFDEVINPSFSYFFKDLEAQFSLKKIGTSFRLERVVRYDKYDDSIKDYVGVFKKAFQITGIEHFKYSFSQKILADLIIYRKELDDYNIDNYNTDALKAKIDFLIRKLVFRIERQSKKEEFSYSFDHNEENILSVENDFPIQSLKNWDEVIKIHYGFTSNYKHDQRKRALLFQEAGSPTNYQYFHACMKIYKDDSRSIEQVVNLIELFNNFAHPTSSRLDKFAKHITSNYLFNNEVSIKIEEEKITKKDFKENFRSFFNIIKNQQNQSFVLNYFPWQKLCQVLAQKIDFLSNDLLNDEKFKVFESLTTLFVESLGKLEESFEWSKRKNLIPFQLSFDNCMSDYELKSDDYGDFKLFFFSSYVVPVDYSYEKKALEDFQQKKIKFETLSATYSKLKTVVTEVEDIEDRLRNSERRSIEILAIFSAISLFSVGSIQILTNNAVANDPSLFYKIVLSFGYCLILFVIVIWIITRNNIKNVQWVHWVLIIILLLGSAYVINNVVGNIPFWKK